MRYPDPLRLSGYNLDRRQAVVLLLLFVGTLSCEGDGNVGGNVPSVPVGPAPEPPAPEPPALSVSFAEDSWEVREGETAEIPIRYEIRELSAPWTLRLEAVPGTASESEFRLVSNAVDIPPGSGISGEVVVQIDAYADLSFAEGRETFSVRFVPDSAMNVAQGSDLEVHIWEGGAAPCPGVLVQAEPPSESDTAPWHLTSRLRIELSAAPTEMVMDLVGPYLPSPWTGYWWGPSVVGPFPGIFIRDWRIEAEGDTLRYSIEIVWGDLNWDRNRDVESLELGFAFYGGHCVGETVAACNVDECELRP